MPNPKRHDRAHPISTLLMISIFQLNLHISAFNIEEVSAACQEFSKVYMNAPQSRQFIKNFPVLFMVGEEGNSDHKMSRAIQHCFNVSRILNAERCNLACKRDVMSSGQTPLIFTHSLDRPLSKSVLNDFVKTARRFGYNFILTTQSLERDVAAKLIGQFKPTYFGWFVGPERGDKILNFARRVWSKILKEFDEIQLAELGYKKSSATQSLEQYFTFQTDEPLHVTARYLGDRSQESEKYQDREIVFQSQGAIANATVHRLFVSPRTIGLDVSLPEQVLANGLNLWSNDDSVGVSSPDAKPNSNAKISRPIGTRAHITIATAAGVGAVQTGFDKLLLWDILQAGRFGCKDCKQKEGGSMKTIRYEAPGYFLLENPDPSQKLEVMFLSRK